MKLCWRDKVVKLRKNIFLLCVVLLSFVCERTVAQERPLLENIITITFDHEPLPAALKKLGQLGGFTFSYGSGTVNKNIQVTADFKDRSVREILDHIFQGTV